jgi:hypothetical protein
MPARFVAGGVEKRARKRRAAKNMGSAISTPQSKAE